MQHEDAVFGGRRCDQPLAIGGTAPVVLLSSVLYNLYIERAEIWAVYLNLVFGLNSDSFRGAV